MDEDLDGPLDPDLPIKLLLAVALHVEAEACAPGPG
jgi:hypothetical protein